MLRSEEQAKQTWCPRRAMLPKEEQNCITGGCMDWCWETPIMKHDRTRTTSGTTSPEPHGYCGFGKPERA